MHIFKLVPLVSLVALVAAQPESSSVLPGTSTSPSAAPSGTSTGTTPSGASTVVTPSGTGTVASASAVPSGVTACQFQCATTASVATGCRGVTDLTCLCTNQAFQQAFAQCITANCTTAEAQAAPEIQRNQCASVVSSTRISSSATPAATTSRASDANTGKPLSGVLALVGVLLAGALAF